MQPWWAEEASLKNSKNLTDPKLFKDIVYDAENSALHHRNE